MTITDAQRWSIAQFCGVQFRRDWLLPRYESEPSQVGPMLLAMAKAGWNPGLGSYGLERWVCDTDRGVQNGSTPNEALCKLIMKIIESGAKPKGDER